MAHSEDNIPSVDETDNFHVVPSTASEGDEERERDFALEEQGNPEVQWSPAMLFLANVVKTIVTPVLKVVFAPKAQKTLIKTTAMVLVFLWIILTSVAAYLTFYRQYVPRTAHIEPIYFQYTAEEPIAVIDLTRGQAYAPLRHDQAYDVSVHLHVPTSDINFDLGNFMVKTWLQAGDMTTLAQASRPSILRYQSKSHRVLHVMAKALPLLVGFTEESQVISVKLIEGFVENKSRPVKQVTVSVSNPRLQVYDAELRVVADFRGLRYYMYHRRIVTALSFIVMFMVIELVCSAIAWKFFGQNVWNKLKDVMDEVHLAEQQRQQEEEEEAEKQRAADEEEHEQQELDNDETASHDQEQAQR
ncbi:putative adipose-regulatory protein-domain-containing protein [Syncephalastrum racemosum]|uniref:Putative adipose-regulatory protein-domain-containing protein n=1 Tax=Syncephalastrum racemosum TaxID=13706 RepID=A0A1X2HAG1_SYNRA|nr:putative adipose-regulatory protein-domain-containing protein [Syncephalastrum racemosum]